MSNNHTNKLIDLGRADAPMRPCAHLRDDSPRRENPTSSWIIPCGGLLSKGVNDER